jgi:hypothetical protein
MTRDYNPSEFQCPKCQQTQHLQLECTASVLFFYREAEIEPSFQFDADSKATCPHCQFSGALKAFNPAVPDPDTLLIIETGVRGADPSTTYH